MRRPLFLIFLFVLVDVLGFSLILPLLPYYARTFGASAAVVGLLLASNPAAQFISAPLLGRLSDTYGRRPLLIVSIVGTVVGFLILGFANSLLILFVSRILDGFLGGNTSLAQAYITDSTDDAGRAKGLGMIGAAFGLGFVVGPALGGGLSVFGYAVPAFAAAGLAVINLVGVVLWLPESLTPERRAALAARPRPSLGLSRVLQVFRQPCLGSVLAIRLGFSFAFTAFEAVFALYAQYRLKLDAQATGFVLTYVGVLSVLVQGVAVGWMTKRFSESRLTLFGSALLAVSLLGWAWAPNLPMLLVVLAPLALSGGLLNPVLSSLLTKFAHQDQVGEVLGLSTSIGSLTRVITSATGGWMIGSLGAWAPGLAGGILMLGVAAFTYVRLLPLPVPATSDCDRDSALPEPAHP